MILQVENLAARYGPVRAMSNLSFDVARGDVCLIIGPNGSAKSTALKCVCGLVRPTAGRVVINGVDVTGMPPWKHVRGRETGVRTALVLQGRRLFASMTVAENLEAGAYTLPDVRARRAGLDRALGMFPYLRDRLEAPAGLLSGGEQQQLALARALVIEPDLLLLDEPTLGLSPGVRGEFFSIVRRLHREGRTVVMVEHDVSAAMPHCTRCYAFAVDGGAAHHVDVASSAPAGGCGM